MKMVIKLVLSIGCGLLLPFIFSGCQAVFTTSPFAEILKPDPADIPPERLSEYCWDVLANGTEAEKTAAYAALELALAGDYADDPEMNYIAGTMALEQADFSLENIMLMMEDPAGIDTLLSSVENNASLLDAGNYLSAAFTAGATLTSTDLVIGGFCDLLGSVGTTANLATEVDYNNPAPEHATAVMMIEDGADALLTIFGDGMQTSAQDLANILFGA